MRLNLELLLGKKVYDPANRCAGRIEEIRARRSGDKLLIHQYILGSAGLLERLSIAGLSTYIITLLGGRSARHSNVVRWNELDLTDWKRPRIKVPREQLSQVEK